ncbi:MAG: DNA mismatch repair endonuclease MutL [Succinivibrio sp.]|nr:DNA mismatch repair endonuclease MutL [Succinivibrio sp.]
MTIRRLSVQLANQIAAGEVVERPASVVKELLENAVDSGADQILCEIEGSGRQLIRVRDNGCGIPAEELPLALAPHATSKIATQEDLASIRTLGFRGEALASIASVTRLTLTSKTAEEQNGYSVQVEGPDQNPLVAPAPHPDGTTVEARELFFNTPARRRFLRSDRTELSRIRDVFVRCAMSHPQIGFSLVSDGRSLIEVSAVRDDDEFSGRLSKLCGGEFKNGAIRVEGKNDLIRVHGLIMPPPGPADTIPDQIYLFLNGRAIADKLISHAVKEACAEAVERQVTVQCVLYLECDPHEVDVNVHPRKDEVRFHESRLIHDTVTDFVFAALKNAGVGADSDSALSLAPMPQEQAQLFDSRSKEESKVNAQSDDFPAGLGAFISPNEVTQHSAVSDSEPKADFTDQRTPSPKVSPGSRETRQRSTESFRNRINAQNFAESIDVSAYTSKFGAESESEQDCSVPACSYEIIDELSEQVLFVRQKGRYFLVNIESLARELAGEEFMRLVKEHSVESISLPMPFAIKASAELIKGLRNSQSAVSRCGFELKLGRTVIEMHKIPNLIRDCDLASFTNKALSLIASGAGKIDSGECPVQLAHLFAGSKSWRYYEKNTLLNKAGELSQYTQRQCGVRELPLARWGMEL